MSIGWWGHLKVWGRGSVVSCSYYRNCHRYRNKN